MHTENDDPAVVKAGIQLNLTAAGWTVIAMIAAAVFLSASRRLAIGFLIPIAAAVAIDLFLSWQVLARRTVSITPVRTVVHRPDGIPLRVAASGPPIALRVSVLNRNIGETTFGLTDGTEAIDFTAEHTTAIDFVRSDTSCSIFGLALAHRWQTHSLPTLHWAPAPSPTRITAPEAIDEVANLREYTPGDRMSRVSWATTARTGRMHVRSAGPGYEEYVVVLNLNAVAGSPGDYAVVSSAAEPADVGKRPSPPVLEGTLFVASTLISQLLEDGHQVRLVTSEVGEYHAAMRQSAIDNPRLEPALPSDLRVTTQVADNYVTDEDDLARRLSLAEVGPTLAWAYGTYIDVSMLGVRTLP